MFLLAITEDDDAVHPREDIMTGIILFAIKFCVAIHGPPEGDSQCC